jgi:hypothetical protein
MGNVAFRARSVSVESRPASRVARGDGIRPRTSPTERRHPAANREDIRRTSVTRATASRVDEPGLDPRPCVGRHPLGSAPHFTHHPVRQLSRLKRTCRHSPASSHFDPQGSFDPLGVSRKNCLDCAQTTEKRHRSGRPAFRSPSKKCLSSSPSLNDVSRLAVPAIV